MKFKLLFVFILINYLGCGGQKNVERRVWVPTEKGDIVYLYKDKVAYIIVAGMYKNIPILRNARTDAKEVSSALSELGFKVKIIEDPTFFVLNKFFSELPEKEGNEKDVALLLYFIGHGSTERLADGRPLGYFLPVDVSHSNIVEKSISMYKIKELAERLKNKHVLIIFDACFSGSIFSIMRAAPLPVMESILMPVRQFISAGNENEPVPDNSIFKRFFLEGLRGEADENKDGYITGSEIGKYLQEKVEYYTQGSQHPQFGKIINPDLDKGEFVFEIRGSAKTSSVSYEDSAKIMPGKDIWYVYKDADSKENHGEWTNWMAERNPGDMMELSMVEESAKFSGNSSIKVQVSFYSSSWGGNAVASMADYWGDKPSDIAYNLTGAKKLVFYAKGERGGEMIKVKVGIVNDKPYGDSTGSPVETQWISLTNEWRKYELPLQGKNLKRIITPFCFVTDKAHNKEREITFYLDEIYFEMK